MAEDPEKPKPPAKSSIREWLETIIFALAIALLIRTFVVQVYMVDGQSMEPTLHTSERLLVNKFIYHIRQPRPGEIVVLRDPSRQSRELVKRVIAIGGETVQVRQGVVYINDKPLSEPFKNTLYTVYPDTAPVQVPQGSVFVMGDNRGQSLDSRIIGPVPLRNLDGEAFFMFWPLNRFGYGPLYTPRAYQSNAQ